MNDKSFIEDMERVLKDSPAEPHGYKFYNDFNGREMLLIVEPGTKWDGWICQRHPDGQWVTVRKADDAERKRIIQICEKLPHTRQ